MCAVGSPDGDRDARAVSAEPEHDLGMRGCALHQPFVEGPHDGLVGGLLVPQDLDFEPESTDQDVADAAHVVARTVQLTELLRGSMGVVLDPNDQSDLVGGAIRITALCDPAARLDPPEHTAKREKGPCATSPPRRGRGVDRGTHGPVSWSSE